VGDRADNPVTPVFVYFLTKADIGSILARDGLSAEHKLSAA
jgi:hypothetical protein